MFSIFRDRKDAGEKLADLMQSYKQADNTIILGLPRGGVVTAYALANKLDIPLDVTCPRKIGAPFSSELAIGAITETGEGVYNTELIQQLSIPEAYITDVIEKEKKVAQHRLAVFRKGLPPRDLAGKTVILVDDGLATGATMKAAIASVRKENAEKIVVAVPVSPEDTFRELETLADEVICIATPSFFQAVGQFYENFEQTEDDEVVKLLHQQKGLNNPEDDQ